MDTKWSEHKYNASVFMFMTTQLIDSSVDQLFKESQGAKETGSRRNDRQETTQFARDAEPETQRNLV